MNIEVDSGSKAFAGGGFLAFREADRLFGGHMARFIDAAVPTGGVPVSKHVELLVGQVIHGLKSTRSAWTGAQNTGGASFVDERLAEQDVRGSYRAIQAIGKAGGEALYESIADTSLEKLGIDVRLVHDDVTSSFFTGGKAARAKYGHSRDHRPDKLQVNLGVVHGKGTGFPKAYVVTEGNEQDAVLFRKLVEKSPANSLIVADRGAVSKENKALVKASGRHYLFGEKLDAPRQKEALAVLLFLKEIAPGYRAHTTLEGGEWRHVFLSEKLREDVRAKRERDADALLAEYAENLKKKRRRKKPKTKRTITAEGETVVVEREVITQRLFRKTPKQLRAELTKDDPLDGVFILSSDSISSAHKALEEYKAKDEVEKVFSALKTTLHLRPFNARKKECVDGVVFLTMLALLVISVLALHARVAGVAVKTLVEELRRVTLLVKNAVDKALKKAICFNLEGLARKLLARMAATAT